MKVALRILMIIILVFVGMVVYTILRYWINPVRFVRVSAWIRNPQAHPDWIVKAGNKCQDAPFVFPTDGYIGFLWGDQFRLGHQHQGIDIFAGTISGKTPVIAVYDGYLTRLPDWKSSVIIRIPADPLQPSQQIWTYYTHMAEESGKSLIVEQFPPGTKEFFVKAGTPLGYQGNYSGAPNNPVGVHLHFSIVKDNGEGIFMNELEIKNTLDPSRYFNLKLNANKNKDGIPICPN